MPPLLLLGEDVKIYKGQAMKLGGPRVWYLMVEGDIGSYWGLGRTVYTRTLPENTEEVVADPCYQEISWLEFMITHGMTKEKARQDIEDYKRSERITLELSGNRFQCSCCEEFVPIEDGKWKQEPKRERFLCSSCIETKDLEVKDG